MRRYKHVRLRHAVGPGHMWIDSYVTDGTPVPRYDDYKWRSPPTAVTYTPAKGRATQGETEIWCKGCAATFAVSLRPYELSLRKAFARLGLAIVVVSIWPYLGLQGLIYLAEVYTSSALGGLLNFVAFAVLCVLIVIPTTMIIIASVYNVRRIWRKLRGRPVPELTPLSPLPLFLGVENHSITFHR